MALAVFMFKYALGFPERVESIEDSKAHIERDFHLVSSGSSSFGRGEYGSGGGSLQSCGGDLTQTHRNAEAALPEIS